MAMTVRVSPPKLDARAVLAAALPAATKAVANVVLDASKGGVPVEEGVLKASGRVEQDGRGAYITYGRDDDSDVAVTGFDGEGIATGTVRHAPSNQYVVIQHEDMELHHPNGGGAKWLEQTIHDDGTRAKALGEATAVLRGALGL